LQRHLARFPLTLADYAALFEHLHAKHHNKERVKIQLVPANLRWCSDTALEMLADYSARWEAPMHIHLVATAHQKEYARRRSGGTALDYIDRFDFLGLRLALGQGVWLSEAVDLVMVARRWSTKVGASHASTAARRGAKCTDHYSARSPTTRPSGGNCQRPSCPMSAVSTAAISVRGRTSPTTVQARGSEASNHLRQTDASSSFLDSPR
jgi:5-methylthioadenosine/S-adenosylhomocysteine deaminase